MSSRLKDSFFKCVLLKYIAIPAMAFLSLVSWQAAAAEPSPLLLYFLMDSARTQQERAIDVRTISSIIDLTTKANPQTFVYFHLTNVRTTTDRFFFNYKTITRSSLDDVNNFLRDYMGDLSKLPPTLRAPRILGSELGLMASNLKDIEGRIPAGSRKWLIAFYDFNLIDPANGVDTSCCALGDGWINAPVSPLRRSFLDQDLSSLKGTKALIFLSKVPPLQVRRNKEVFMQHLLEKAGAELDYLGPIYPYRNASPIALNYVRSLDAGQLNPIDASRWSPTEALQIFDGSGKETTITAYR